MSEKVIAANAVAILQALGCKYEVMLPSGISYSSPTAEKVAVKRNVPTGTIKRPGPRFSWDKGLFTDIAGLKPGDEMIFSYKQFADDAKKVQSYWSAICNNARNTWGMAYTTTRDKDAKHIVLKRVKVDGGEPSPVMPVSFWVAG
jgi:hypothetical protein